MNIFNVSGTEIEVDNPSNSNQVKGTAGNIDITKLTDNNAGPVGETSQAITPEGKNPLIVIDGPLGRAVTQALNLTYANEDTGTVAMIAGTLDRQIKNQDAIQGGQQGTFVYALDGENVSQRDCVEATDWMMRQQAAGHSDIVISLEARKAVSKKAKQIEDMAKSTGAKVVYNKKALWNHVKTRGEK